MNYSKEKIEEFLTSNRTQMEVKNLITKFSLNEDSDKILFFIREVSQGKRKFNLMPLFLNTELDIEFRRAVDIGYEFIQQIFKPIEKDLENYFAGQKSQKRKVQDIQKISGKTSTDKDQAQAETQEIDQLKTSMPRTAGGALNHEQIASQIFEKLKFSTQNKVLESRFKNVIIAFLKDIRGAIETRETLIRSQKVGGLGFKEPQADKIMATLKQEAKKIASKAELRSQVRSADRHLVSRKTPSVLGSELAQLIVGGRAIPPARPETEKIAKGKVTEKFRKEFEQVTEIAKNHYPLKMEPGRTLEVPEQLKSGHKIEAPEGPQKHKIPQKHEVPQKAGLETKPEMAKPRRIISDLSKRQGTQTPAVKPEPKEPQPVIPKQQPAPTTERPKPTIKPFKPRFDNLVPSDQTSDWQPKSKLVGPIEEIRGLTLADFRRWSEDPEKSAERLKEKIELLAEESLEKQALGVRAWRASEIYSLYLEIGQESMEQGKSVEQIINESKAEGKEPLSRAEFEAIADLNRELRF